MKSCRATQEYCTNQKDNCASLRSKKKKAVLLQNQITQNQIINLFLNLTSIIRLSGKLLVSRIFLWYTLYNTYLMSIHSVFGTQLNRFSHS